MNLTKSFNNNLHDIRDLTLREHAIGVIFMSNYNDRGYGYAFEAAPDSYLNIAKKAAKELERISGMKYCIMAKHPDSTTWRAL